MPPAPEIKTIFTVELTPYVDGLETMLTMTETTGKQLQGLLSVQPKQPDFSGLQSQLTGITQRTADYVAEQAQLPPVIAAGTDETKKFGGSNDDAGKKVEGHTLKMRGLKRESRESFQAIAFLAISISSMAATAGNGETQLGKMSRTMGEGVSAAFGLASMLVATEIATGSVAIGIGAVVAVTFALIKIFGDSEAKINTQKSAMEGYTKSLDNATRAGLEEYRVSLLLKIAADKENIRQIDEANKKTDQQYEVIGVGLGLFAKLTAAHKDNSEATQQLALDEGYLAEVNKIAASKEISFMSAKKFADEALTASVINDFEKRRQAANRTYDEEKDQYAGNARAIEAAGKKHAAEMRKIAYDESNFNQQLADQDFEQDLTKIKEQGAKGHTQTDEIDLLILAAQRQHYKEQYDAILAITGQLSNEQILKKKELETKLTQLELDETEKRIALKKREAADIDDLANKDFEITLASIRTRGIEAGKSDWQIALEEIAREKMKNDAEQNLLDAQYEREEISDSDYAKKKAALDLKAAQLNEAQAKEENKRDDAVAKEKKEKLDAEKQNRQNALDDFSSNLQEAGKLSKAAFEASKAYEIATTIINTESAAEAAFKALAGIPVVGPELGVIAAAAAIVAGMARVDAIANTNPTGYAFGGEVTGPTLALLGEGNDNEIVAPKRNFIQVWREDLLPLALKDIRDRGGSQGSSGATSADIAALRNEIIALRKSNEKNRPVTIINSDTDWTRFQKGMDRAARIKKMRIL